MPLSRIPRIILLALTIAWSLTACSDDESSSTTGPTNSRYPITIMSWNVENFEAAGAFANIAAEVKKQAVDILVLCEVQDDDSDEANFTAALSSAGWTMPHHSLSSMQDRFNAIGVFSRYAITATAEVTGASGPRDIYKITVSLTNGKAITLYGCHLKSGANRDSYNQRVAQSSALASYIRTNHTLSTDYVVVLGDMNSMGDGGSGNADFASGGTLENLTLKDDGEPSNDFLAVNYTYLPSSDTHSFPSLLDHIILSPQASSRYIPGSVAVPTTPWSGGAIYSDHRPVLLQLNMNGAGSSGGETGQPLPFTTDVYTDFAADGWTMTGITTAYYTTNAKFDSVDDTATTPELQAGTVKITFNLVTGSTSGPYANITVYGKADPADSWNAIGGAISTAGSGVVDQHRLTASDDPQLHTYKYFKFVRTSGSVNIGLSGVTFSDTP